MANNSNYAREHYDELVKALSEMSEEELWDTFKRYDAFLYERVDALRPILNDTDLWTTVLLIHFDHARYERMLIKAMAMKAENKDNETK